MGFLITEDHINDDSLRVGTKTDDFNKNDIKFEVQTFDDEGILYYVADCNTEGDAEDFFNYSAIDAGVAYSNIKEKGSDKWTPFIG